MKNKLLPRFLHQSLCLAAFLTLTLAGCDTLEDGTETVLLQKEATFRFEFAAESVPPGKDVTFTSRDQVDLSNNLDGFAKSEIVAAEVVSANLQRIQPPLTSLNQIVRAAELQIVSEGLSGVTVARQNDFPAGPATSLTVNSVQDVSAHLRKPAFGLTLTMTPADLEPLEDYALEVTVRLRITVEGL